jgi:hypothetical protein
MQPAQELTSAKFFSAPADDELSAAAPPAAPHASPAASLRLLSIVVGAAVVATIVGTIGIGLLRGSDKPRDNSPLAANLFLWAIGSDLTWSEYQAQQRARGRARLDEKEYDWTQQALNDAYIGDWDPEE